MNLNFSIKQWLKSTVRKAVKKIADTVEVAVALAARDREWQSSFFAMLKSLRPWPEGRQAVEATLRARRDAVRR